MGSIRKCYFWSFLGLREFTDQKTRGPDRSVHHHHQPPPPTPWSTCARNCSRNRVFLEENSRMGAFLATFCSELLPESSISRRFLQIMTRMVTYRFLCEACPSAALRLGDHPKPGIVQKDQVTTTTTSHQPPYVTICAKNCSRS